MPRAPVCPFYGRVKREDLVCLMGGSGTTGKDEMLMRFPNQICRLHYWVAFCCQDWEQCTLAKALWEGYERKEAAASRSAKCTRAAAKDAPEQAAFQALAKKKAARSAGAAAKGTAGKSKRAPAKRKPVPSNIGNAM